VGWIARKEVEAMLEIIIIVLLVVLLFGGGGLYWGRR
jgi:hypothetical protein